MNPTLLRTALAGALITLVWASRATASDGSVSDLAVQIVAAPGVNPAIVDAATATVIRIYQACGVRVLLNDGVPLNDGTAWRRIVIRLSATNDLPVAVGDSLVAGIAQRTGNEPGRIGYVFYNAVSAMAIQHDLSVGTLLGYAMAHELGHLLLPLGAHGKAGVMRGNWDANDMKMIRLGRFAMAQHETVLIHHYLDSLEHAR
jgi:hypothetical protein